MKTLGSVLTAASLSVFVFACGSTNEPFGLGIGAKGEADQRSPLARPYGTPQKVTWKDGTKTAGAYVTAQVDYFPAELLQEYDPEKPVPELGQYLIEAYPQPALAGHLGFFVGGDILFRLGTESFSLEVEATVEGKLSAEDYDLALLKFKCEYENEESDTCTEGYNKIVVPLSDAINGVTVTRRHEVRNPEANDERGLISRLRSHGPYLNERYRAGFTGTWKIIVVPREPTRAQRNDDMRIYGDPAVKIQTAWITAEPMDPAY